MLAGLLSLALAASAPQLKVAVMPLASVEGVPGKTAEALTEAVSAEVRRRSGGQVITQREISTLLSLEQQKSMMGCQNDACYAEIGGALGVDRVVLGDLAVLGESWLFHLKLLDPTKAQVLRNSDRRLRGGTIDDVLDALPSMVGELFPGEGKAESAPQAVASPEPPPAKHAASVPEVRSAVVEVPRRGEHSAVPEPPAGDEAPGLLPPPTAPGRTEERAALSVLVERSVPVPLRVRGELKVFTDGRNHFLALAPFGERGSPVFFGRGRKLYRQEIVPHRERETEGREVALWDPRVPSGRVLVMLHGEEALVRCGGHELTLAALPKRQSGGLLFVAAYYAPPFARKPLALARDDEGNFFYVDIARDLEPRGPDYHLYTGPKDALVRVEIEGIERQGDAILVRTAKGRLRLSRQGPEGPLRAEWLTEGGRRMLAWMDPAENEALIFGELGVYGGVPLGSPCDLVFLRPQ